MSILHLLLSSSQREECINNKAISGQKKDNWQVPGDSPLESEQQILCSLSNYLQHVLTKNNISKNVNIMQLLHLFENCIASFLLFFTLTSNQHVCQIPVIICPNINHLVRLL